MPIYFASNGENAALEGLLLGFLLMQMQVCPEKPQYTANQILH